jgi:phospholipid/cholesterol/gamma-HCH transport system substrate-binding protein
VKRSSDFIVGLVVIGVAVALVASILWLRETDIGSRQRHVEARFRDIGNTRIGNAVVIRGVRNGRIDRMELAPGGWVLVRMTIERDVVLPPDPVVLLNESSLFGEWQATIAERTSMPPDRDVRRQVDEASGAGDVLPGATLPGIGQLTAVAGQIAGNVASVAERVQVAFDDAAARELRGSISDFSQLSRTLATTVREHSTDLDTLSAGLRDAVGTMSRTAALAQRMAQRVDSSSTTGEVRLIVDNLTAASRDLRATATQVNQLTARFAESQARLDRLLGTSDSIFSKINAGSGTAGLLVNDPGLYRNTDSLMVQLRLLIGDMQANPRRYFNFRIF